MDTLPPEVQADVARAKQRWFRKPRLKETDSLAAANMASPWRYGLTVGTGVGLGTGALGAALAKSPYAGASLGISAGILSAMFAGAMQHNRNVRAETLLRRMHPKIAIGEPEPTDYGHEYGLAAPDDYRLRS